MIFTVIQRFERPPYNARSSAFLVWDDWNDYSYLTLFHLRYADENSTLHEIGSVKIGFFGQTEGERSLSRDSVFEKLGSKLFSLGQSDKYYESLNEFGEKIRDEILISLNDIAKLPDIYNQAINEPVTKISLLRTLSPTTVTGQFRRIAFGGVRLTSYSFTFISPKIKGSSSKMELEFNVEPESFPPTNIHILIGRNGVGKTHLLNNMINTLIDEENKSKKYGEFISEIIEENDQLFANLISITFSAFDETEPKPEIKDKTKGIQFSYIGLKRVQSSSEKNQSPKSTTMLRNEFFRSLNMFKMSSKAGLWKKCIEILESDPNFREAEILSLIEIENDEEFKNSAFEIFRRLSSGHKIVLLIITRLIETLQERSLVLIDEPEAHLHPPLLSAFIRAFSELLITTNGVAIVATHSPVILQEVPRSCVWKLRRTSAEAISERLDIESFGENVGILTNEIFGHEVTHSGFYNLINQAIEQYDDYDDVVNAFGNQLGMEARAIVMSRISNNN